MIEDCRKSRPYILEICQHFIVMLVQLLQHQESGATGAASMRHCFERSGRFELRRCLELRRRLQCSGRLELCLRFDLCRTTPRRLLSPTQWQTDGLSLFRIPCTRAYEHDLG